MEAQAGQRAVKKGLSVFRDVTTTDASSMVLDKLLNPPCFLPRKVAVCKKGSEAARLQIQGFHRPTSQPGAPPICLAFTPDTTASP